MSQKSQTHRDKVPVLGSETSIQRKRTKSALNMTASSSSNQTERIAQRTQNAETRFTNPKNTTRSFNLTIGTNRESPKKNYMKNSEKTIKPPEKPLKATRPTPQSQTAFPNRSAAPVREKTSTLLARTNTNIKNIQKLNLSRTQVSAEARLVASKRSLTFDNLTEQNSTVSACSRIDNKSIDELARRLEHLQTIFMNKLEILHSREPNAKKKAYKLVAMVVGDEAKLLVDESDAQSLPYTIPARSVQDLYSKISKFFTGCLIAFTDKLRSYQSENSIIDCDEIYRELKSDEQVFCAILKDWVLEMCDEADTTLIPVEPEKSKDSNVDVRDFGTQSDLETLEPCEMPDKDFVDYINLRTELSEVKQQLSRKNENYLEEVAKLKEAFESKNNELKEFLQIEKTLVAAKDEKINKVQELNENLTQQLQDSNGKVETLNQRIDELNAKLQNDTDLAAEMAKIREELQTLRQENKDLGILKSNFLLKLNRRATRIDLLDKEIKQQKRKMELQNKEIEDLKLEFEAKVKENREYKESLDARNQLIDHLRKAVEIEQRKRKECEENLANRTAEKHFKTGVKFHDLANETKQIKKHTDSWKRSFNETAATMNFVEKMPTQIKCPLSNAPKEKIVENNCSLDIQLNILDSTELKDVSDVSSSEEQIAVNQRFKPRKAHTIVVKKR